MVCLVRIEQGAIQKHERLEEMLQQSEAKRRPGGTVVHRTLGKTSAHKRRSKKGSGTRRDQLIMLCR